MQTNREAFGLKTLICFLVIVFRCQDFLTTSPRLNQAKFLGFHFGVIVTRNLSQSRCRSLEAKFSIKSNGAIGDFAVVVVFKILIKKLTVAENRELFRFCTAGFFLTRRCRVVLVNTQFAQEQSQPSHFPACTNVLCLHPRQSNNWLAST